jgi:hypothetical protein
VFVTVTVVRVESPMLIAPPPALPATAFASPVAFVDAFTSAPLIDAPPPTFETSRWWTSRTPPSTR